MPYEDRHPVTGCRASSLFGLWLIEPMVHESLKNQALSYDLNVVVENNRKIEEARIAEESKPENKDKVRLPYRVMNDRAIMTISGPTTKYPSSFASMMGGTSTMELTRAMRKAVADDGVKAIVLDFDDAPGGTVNGAFDFVKVIQEVREKKPLIAVGSDKMTSGAMLFASQCNYIYCNSNCEVGSIGTMTYLIDTSKKYEAAGIHVIPIKAGKYKGTGIPGVQISDDQIAQMQSRVNDQNELFIKAVAVGRRIPQKDIRALEAGVYVGERALKHGLVDEVATFEEAMSKPIPEKRGTRTVVTVPATQSGANPVRSTGMLTATQLDQFRKLPGAAHITEDNADTVLGEVATKLQSDVTALDRRVKELEPQVPTKISDQIAGLTIKPFVRELDVMQKEGKILPEQHAAIKAYVMDGDKPKASVVAGDGTIMISADVVTKILDANKPSGLTTTQTGAQPAPKQNPSDVSDPKTVADVPAERSLQLLDLIGIRPVNPAAGAAAK